MIGKSTAAACVAACLSAMLFACHGSLPRLDGHPVEGDGSASRRDEQDRTAVGPGATAKLRVLETTDLHANIESFDYYKNAPTLDTGLARTATLVRRARAEVTNALLIDNGDLIQGSPLGDWFQKERDPKHDLHPVFEAMNLLGYDAANLGNHDFNYGLDFLEASLAGAKFPYVSANVLNDDGPTGAHEPLILPYVILTRDLTTDDGRHDQIKIGVIGFTPPQIMAWDRTNLTGKVTAADIVDTATKLVPKIRAEGADLVIAVPHSGINANPRAGNDENAVYYLAGVPGIDAILCGHSHQVFPSKTYADIPDTDLANGLLRGVPTVMAGFWGSHVGVVDLQLKKTDQGWRVTGGTAAAREVKSTVAATDSEADIHQAVAADHQATLAYLGRNIGTAAGEIHTFFAQIAPSPGIQIVQDAQRWYVQKALDGGGDATAALKGLPILSASAPLKAGAKPDDYTDVAAGPLSLRNVADLYVYPNTLRVVKVTGAQVLEWLEMAAITFNQIKPNDTSEQMLTNPLIPAYTFDQLSGVTYTIDVTQPAKYDRSGKTINPAARRILDLKYGGTPIDPTQAFLVVTNNYRANGGGNFPALDGTTVVLDPGRENREVLRDYVTAVGAVGANLEQSWHLQPVPGATNLIFRSSPDARTKAADVAGLKLAYVAMGGDGFAKFQVVFPTK